MSGSGPLCLMLAGAGAVKTLRRRGVGEAMVSGIQAMDRSPHGRVAAYRRGTRLLLPSDCGGRVRIAADVAAEQVRNGSQRETAGMAERRDRPVFSADDPEMACAAASRAAWCRRLANAYGEATCLLLQFAAAARQSGLGM